MEKPYQGQEPYLFLSYSHIDMDAAMEIVTALQRSGYRVWYDEGIDPGTEWDEIVASHVESCNYFVALISKSYLASDNCKDELNFARELNKSRLLVYLESVELPAGMRMRLSRLQAIYRYHYASQNAFYEKLSEAKGIKLCQREAVPPDLEKMTFAEKPSTKAVNHSVSNKPPLSISLSKSSPSLVHPAETALRKNAKIIERGTCGDAIRWALDEEGVLTVSGQGEIPKLEPWDDYRYGIHAWHKNNLKRSIKTARITTGVTKIGENAFYECENLQLVSLPKTVTSIEKTAFYQCKQLTGIYLPNSVHRIGAQAFAGCRALKLLHLPERLYILEEGAFMACDFSILEIPKTLKVIPSGAFWACSHLRSLSLQQGTEKNRAFCFS